MIKGYFPVSSYTRNFLTLGLKEDANFETCRRVYLKLLKQWHPDRFAFDDPQREVAEQKTMEITGAFERLKRLKFSDELVPAAPSQPHRPDPSQRITAKLDRLPIKISVSLHGRG